MRGPRRRTWAGCAALLLALAPAGPASAWVYPEHRDIALLAVQTLDAPRRAVFDRAWEDARVGHEARLCRQGAFELQGVAPLCIDWAALAAIAGDHSCSSRQMLQTVLASDWILAVADVAAQLKADLGRIPVVPPAGVAPRESSPEALGPDLRRRMQSETLRAERLNALRVSDIRLQRADPGYATRAGANNAHFLMPRPRVDIGALDYGQMAAYPGAELNAVGVYATYHLSALQKASRLAHETLDAATRRALLQAVLADEAFALHFLQDTYAAGHVAGTWGDASQRKGTHDYYNEHGLEVFTWGREGGSVVLMGDAHMRPEDAQLAAAAVRRSLSQVIDALEGRGGPGTVPHTPAAAAEPDAFDVCRSQVFAPRPEGLQYDEATAPLFVAVLVPTPVPGLGAGLGATPRFRTELGTFIGLSGTIDVRHLDGGFLASQTQSGRIGGLDLSLRMGLGLEGVMGESGDGLVFASIGLRAETASSNRFLASPALDGTGNVFAAIPARSGVSFRLRMPFYLVPGDLLLLSPLALFNRQAYTQMAVTASNGGLIPWQLGWATPVGRFQFVLGRELGITQFGRVHSDQLIAPPGAPGDGLRLVSFKSTLYDLPILEYRPYRSFAGNQSSTVLFQLFGGADVPDGHTVFSPPGAAPVAMDTVWSLGLRMVFDWRHYR